MSARGEFAVVGRAQVRSTLKIGRAYASVFPEPVGATATTSFPALTAGITRRCTGVGVVMPIEISALSSNASDTAAESSARAAAEGFEEGFGDVWTADWVGSAVRVVGLLPKKSRDGARVTGRAVGFESGFDRNFRTEDPLQPWRRRRRGSSAIAGLIDVDLQSRLHWSMI